MSEKNFNEVFSKRLRYYMNRYNINQAELAKKLGVGTTSVHNWCGGIKTPRMDKVDKMCEIFGCLRSDLINDNTNASFSLSDEEQEVIESYRTADPGTRSSVRKLLDIKEKREKSEAV